VAIAEGGWGLPNSSSFFEGRRWGHDQLFKALLEKFFRDFLELFFPAVAERLDFGTLAFLDKGLFADLPQGPTREVDVARLETHGRKAGSCWFIQSRPEKDFARRMFEVDSRTVSSS